MSVLLNFTYKSWQREKIFCMLQHMKIPCDGVLMVHSAFKGFSRDGYEAAEVLKSLVTYMELGTLLMPTMSWRYVKINQPYFDELETPSNTGILSELFRQTYASFRSLHPTHSVAGCGKLLPEILGKHHHSMTPCDHLSPFAQLVNYDAYILMLGVGMDCCTLIHHVEESIAPNYYVRPQSETELYQCRNRFGRISTVQLRRHLFLPRNYWQFQDKLAAIGELHVFRCDNAICIGFPAKALYQQVTHVLQNKPDAIIANQGQRYRLM